MNYVEMFSQLSKGRKLFYLIVDKMRSFIFLLILFNRWRNGLFLILAYLQCLNQAVSIQSLPSPLTLDNNGNDGENCLNGEFW